MIVHVKGSETELEPVPDDEFHSGDARSAYRTLFASSDSALELGMWEFAGEQRTTPQDGYEEILIVLEGSAEITCDGDTYELAPGDVLIYDCPIGGKLIRSPSFKAAYVVRHRGKEPVSA